MKFISRAAMRDVNYGFTCWIRYWSLARGKKKSSSKYTEQYMEQISLDGQGFPFTFVVPYGNRGGVS